MAHQTTHTVFAYLHVVSQIWLHGEQDYIAINLTTVEPPYSESQGHQILCYIRNAMDFIVFIMHCYYRTAYIILVISGLIIF